MMVPREKPEVYLFSLLYITTMYLVKIKICHQKCNALIPSRKSGQFMYLRALSSVTTHIPHNGTEIRLWEESFVFVADLNDCFQCLLCQFVIFCVSLSFSVTGS